GQLASHRSAIEDERGSVESRLRLVEAEQQMRRDERAEIELRAHVGELSESEVSTAFEALDKTLGQLEGEKDALRGSLDDLLGLLAGAPAEESTASAVHAPVPAAPVAASAPVVPPAAPPAAPPAVNSSFDELAFLSSVVGADGKPANGGAHP